jgi:hypothetical protein
MCHRKSTQAACPCLSENACGGCREIRYVGGEDSKESGIENRARCEQVEAAGIEPALGALRAALPRGSLSITPGSLLVIPAIGLPGLRLSEQCQLELWEGSRFVRSWTLPCAVKRTCSKHGRSALGKR